MRCSGEICESVSDINHRGLRSDGRSKNSLLEEVCEARACDAMVTGEVCKAINWIDNCWWAGNRADFGDHGQACYVDLVQLCIASTDVGKPGCWIE